VAHTPLKNGRSREPPTPLQSTNSNDASKNGSSANSSSDRNIEKRCSTHIDTATKAHAGGRTRSSSAYVASTLTRNVTKNVRRSQWPTIIGSLLPRIHWWTATIAGSSGGYWTASISPGSFRSR